MINNRSEINKANYEKNKLRGQEKYLAKKARVKELEEYYNAQKIQVLMGLKDYVENSPEKLKL